MLKIHFILPFLCSVFLIGCKKTQSSPPSPDNVTVHQFNPFQEITSVDSFYYLPGSSSPTISPTDSSSNYLLDIDGDSNPDFILTVDHKYQWVSNSNPEANLNFEMFISGIDTTSEIACVKSGFGIPQAEFYTPGKSINQAAKWKNKSWLMRNGVSYYPQCDFSGTQYIGLRTRTKISQHYCWLKISKDPIQFKNKLLIQSFGYNQSNGNDITAGQGE